MRALLLLCALCVASSLQAADIDLDSPPEAVCPDRAAAGDAGVEGAIGEAIKSAPSASPPAARRPSTTPDRNRMSTRWHSLLPGMFR